MDIIAEILDADRLAEEALVKTINKRVVYYALAD